MDELQLFQLAKPFLDKGMNKNFQLHTEGVLLALKDIMRLTGEGDFDLLLPAVIFHDTGWSNVPISMQGEANSQLKEEGMRKHLEEGARIAGEVLPQYGYSASEVAKIARIIGQHKYCDPKDVNSQILIDADNLSDIYQEQFAADMDSYNNTAENLLKYRLDNTFYFPESKEIFDREVAARKDEYGIK